MHASETLENSNLLVIQAIDDLPEALWDMPGVCGDWSVKEVVSHLTAYELLMIDMMHAIQGDTPSPYLLRWLDSQKDFDQVTVESRRYHTAQQVENEYQDAQVRASALLAEIPVEMADRHGLMPWYTEKDSSLKELILDLCGHIRKHSEEIVRFREKNKELE